LALFSAQASKKQNIFELLLCQGNFWEVPKKSQKFSIKWGKGGEPAHFGCYAEELALAYGHGSGE